MNDKERLRIFEKVFSELHFARICYQTDKVHQILNLIDSYDFCNNGCNGIQTEREIRKSKDRILERLRDFN